MGKEKRYLITTADERTWKFDRPVIFLGEWCRLYDRKHVWQHMDAIVASPYGLGMKKKDADYAEVRILEEKFLAVLCDTLNKHHGTRHEARFWRIFLGHWIRRYVEVMLNRVNTLEQCLHTHLVSGTTVYANDQYALATLDSYSSFYAYNDDRWNNLLNVRILNLLSPGSFPIEAIEGCESIGFRCNELVTTPTLKRTFFKWSRHQAGKLLSGLARDSDIFIINSYLPKKVEIKLQLDLSQCPQLWTSPKLEIIEKFDSALRRMLARQFTSQSENNLENILSLMLFELLPLCFLEGFVNLNKLVKKQPWPKSPKLIFTSNNFDTDEVFKLWAATKAEVGSKYFTGQHGNAYGTNRYTNPTIEEATADKFLTWGWSDGLPQHTPAFIFKTAGRRIQNNNPRGELLLIEASLNCRICTWDITTESFNYFSDQQNFVNELAITPKQNLVIRLKADRRFYNWNEDARWQEFDPALKIDKGDAPITDLIARSRLVVHSYDSTGILETMSQNIPTLAFWQDGLDHIRDSAKPYYQILVDVGIVHLSPESVAQKVNEVWDEVEYWWAQTAVQVARKQFCDRYARTSENPVREIKSWIEDEVRF